MFCTNCGKQIDEDAQFCANCGTKLKRDTTNQTAMPIKDVVSTAISEIAEEKTYTEQVPESVEMATNVSPNDDLEPERSASVVESKVKQDAEASMRTSVSDTVLRKLIGKNADYYMSAFEKVKQGQKTKFMWSSLLFPIYFVLYRNCMPIFKSKYMIPAMLAYVVGPVAMMLGTLLPSIEAMLVLTVIGGILSGIGLFWITIVAIQLGFRFPKLYYEYLLNLIKEQNITEHNCDEFVEKYSGGSWKNVVIAMIIIVLLSGVSIAVTSVGALSVGFDNDFMYDDTTEYIPESYEDNVIESSPYYSVTKYFIARDFDIPEYAPSVVFYPDGNYILYDNYYSGIDQITGKYEIVGNQVKLTTGEEYYFEDVYGNLQLSGDYSSLVALKYYSFLSEATVDEFNSLVYNAEGGKDAFIPYADEYYVSQEEAKALIMKYLDNEYGFSHSEYEIYESEVENGYNFEVYNPFVQTTSKLIGMYFVESSTGNIYDPRLMGWDDENALLYKNY